MVVVAAIGAIAASALPMLLPYAPMVLKLGLGLLPPNAAQVVTKGLDFVKKGLGPIQAVVDALKHVAGVTGADPGADISVDDLNRLLGAMNAAVDSFAARADEIRDQAGGQGT